MSVLSSIPPAPAPLGSAESRTHTPTLQHSSTPVAHIALLTGGGDKPYALGMASALAAQDITMDFIGSDDLDTPELRHNPLLNFLNLRGDQNPRASALRKLLRVLAYYVKLIRYAATARPRIFHLLWNNKFEFFDRTFLMLYYRLLGKRLVFTAHNVNAGKRDGKDSCLNRLTLRAQYRLVHHIFVHTQGMKRELTTDFDVPESKVTVIPFGINNTVPNTALTSAEARQKLGIPDRERVLLFFGNIAPYKGLEYAVRALAQLVEAEAEPASRFTHLSRRSQTEADHASRFTLHGPYRLLIAGRPKEAPSYWQSIQQEIASRGISKQVLVRSEYIPDEETEIYFKAADVLVLPYTHIFQSGVLFLGYSFGLPVIASDVGSLKEEIVEGKTGFVFKPRDSADLTRVVQKCFESDLYQRRETSRELIREYANERYSWTRVGEITRKVYDKLLSDT